ncbi:MAG: tandem-95 repeat protein, partial [Oscillatoria princeps RMCB-10]|nr:tandem-95 repeat protein [Oscillatoria princeps RMCB-10]
MNWLRGADCSRWVKSTAVAAFVIGGAGLWGVPVRAEGSKELVSSGGNRPFLEWTNLAATAGIPRKTTLKVYVQSGETVNLGSSVFNSYGGGTQDIEYRSPSGVQNFCDVTAAGYGYIDTRAKEDKGPFPAAGGYTPCSFVATETGIYEVDFHGREFTASNTGSPPATSIPAATDTTVFPFITADNQRQTVGAWDITVTSGGTPRTGRVFADYLAINMGNTGSNTNNNSSISSQTYILTEDGYRYRVDLNGLQPFGFIFFANKKGFTDGSGNPLYQSIQLSSGATLPANRLVTYTEKIFLNIPDSTMPGFASGPSGSTWLNPPTAPPPTPTGFTFRGNEGNTPGQTGTTPLGGSFRFNAPSPGSYTIKIDIDGDPNTNSPQDRILIGAAAVGQNTVSWDGRDGQGNPVPPSVNPYGATITLNAGEVHFPFLDAENNPTGVIIERQVPAGSNPDTVYYNDTGLTGGTPPSPPNRPFGVSSATGAHSYGNVAGSQTDFGNDKGIDTWTYLPSDTVTLVGGILVAAADLRIAKTDNLTTVAAGSQTTYTITVTNFNNPPSSVSNVTGARVEDTLPAAITGVTWTCAITAGTGSCGAASGSGNVINTTVNLNSGATATYTVTGTVNPATPVGTALNNTAKVTRPNDVADPVDQDGSGGNNISESAADQTTVVANTPPVATDDTASTNPGVPVSIPVLGNDSDPDNNLDPSSVTITAQPANGTVSVNPDGSITYTPNPGFTTGTDTFTYQVCDSGNPVSCDTATVTVTVPVPPNNPPVATDDTASTNPGVPVSIPVLGNDSDPDNNLDPSSVTIASQPPNGTVTVNPDGSITYTPNPGFTSGTDTFSYQVCDTGNPVSCDTATVTVTVPVPPNNPPVATDDTASTNPGVPVSIPVLDNDTDSDDNLNPSSVTIASQ